MKTIEGNYVMCSSAGKAKSSHGHSKSIPRRKYYCKDCGYFHLTHMALYNIDSRNYAWEDVFYREYERRQKRVRA